MIDDAFHLLADGQLTVGVATLAGVYERLDAALYAQLPRLGRRQLISALLPAHQVKAKLLHLVFVFILFVARYAEIEVLCATSTAGSTHTPVEGTAVTGTGGNLTSQTVQWYLVSIWSLHALQV